MSRLTPLRQHFETALRQLGPLEGPIGVAVSGGGDSVALLCLLHRTGREIRAVTVDHGLRGESADEARAVARFCAKLGVEHEILNWHDWDGQGNLQAAARDARRGLIADWAAKSGIKAVALGHTLDDQAETFLMRLARGSGVDGLSGMAARTARDGVIWLRPLMGIARTDLREFLVSEGIEWVDDPSNEDTRFDRVKARRALGVLADLGLDAARLTTTARQMARAREVLEMATLNLAEAAAKPTETGEVSLDLALLLAAPEETRLRLLAWSLQWVAGAVYRPRLAALEDVFTRLEDCSLHGCLIRQHAGRLIVRREPARVEGQVAAGTIWDGRWETSGPAGVTVAALGEAGLAQCPDWRETGHKREILLATPAFWRERELLANPFVKQHASCHAALRGGKMAYFINIVRR